VPLAACISILLIKRIDWSPGMIAMLAVLLIASVHCGIQTRKTQLPWSKGLARLGIVGLWIVWAGMTYEWHNSARAGRGLVVQPARPVVCIGDSLTAFGYPRLLQEMISLPVVDLSSNGITTTQALSSLPALIKANPQVVVIELGGHDFLTGHSRVATRENLKKIIDACRSIGAEVILMEIPRGFITDPFGGLERELARREGLELIPDTAIRRLVLWSPVAPPGMWLKPQSRLSDDGLHPNANGNRLLAAYVADALTQIYGPGVRAGR
jgi:acyl-CoA thioesterase I